MLPIEVCRLPIRHMSWIHDTSCLLWGGSAFPFLADSVQRMRLDEATPYDVDVVWMFVCPSRIQRLRRLVFSDKFYSLYGGIGWGGAGGMGSPEIEVVGQERWINKPHPRLADPTDRRSAQLRRGQVILECTTLLTRSIRLNALYATACLTSLAIDLHYFSSGNGSAFDWFSFATKPLSRCLHSGQ